MSRGVEPSADELNETLQRYADLARPLGWVVQLYTPMSTVDTLAELLEGDALGYVCRMRSVFHADPP